MGRTEDAQRRVAPELLTNPPCFEHRVDDDPEELFVEQAHDFGGRPGRGELGGADQVDEEDGDVALLPAEFGTPFQRPARTSSPT